SSASSPTATSRATPTTTTCPIAERAAGAACFHFRAAGRMMYAVPLRGIQMRLATVSAAVLCLLAAAALAIPPAMAADAARRTLRVDIQHSGDAGNEHYALDRVVVEPLP